ncbi:hypothetical protein [Streptomyces sp. NPDC058657]|uniref:hypothetical protein n=1 Tax=unclassified Streptomyces TaxID=2593676 RepID=UPI0036673D6C
MAPDVHAFSVRDRAGQASAVRGWAGRAAKAFGAPLRRSAGALGGPAGRAGVSFGGGPTGRAAVSFGGRGGRVAVAVAALLALAGTAGCGIRTTNVPVDAGAAPSRVSCDVPASTASGRPEAGSAVRVFLVCGAGLVPVQRVVNVSAERLADDRLRAAQVLLDALQKEPSEAEQQAGFSTDVRGSLTVYGPRQGDPSASLRLSRDPDDLPPHALAQIVCTYSGSAADDGGGAVELGGPSEDPPRKYPCTAALKARPEGEPTVGDPRPSPSAPATPSGAPPRLP